MKKRFKWAFYLMALPAGLGGLVYTMLPLGYYERGLVIDSFDFWVHLVLGIWFTMHVAYFIFVLVNERPEFWEGVDDVDDRRRKLAEAEDGYLRARGRYIKEWERLNGIWNRVEGIVWDNPKDEYKNDENG